MEVQAEEQQQREQEVTLTGGDPQPESAASGQALDGGSDRSGFDVGVLADLVGIGVVARVFAHPPRVAHPHEHRGEDAADTVVRPTGDEDLPMGGLVAEEGELGEDQAE